VAAASGWMGRHAVPKMRKGHGRQAPGKDNDVRGSPKGRTLQKRRRARPKRNKGIRDGSCVWRARRYFMRTLDKPSDRRS
jgi:hypothetical protein